MENKSLTIFRALSSLLLTYLTTCITVLIGFIGHFFYWLVFDLCGLDQQRTDRKLNVPPKSSSSPNEYYSLIIGSGFSGLGMAIKLKQLGTDNFTIIERHGHVGGTWYANKYPGCACDVPSNLYSFSFEPNPNWSYFFSRQPEIGEYLEQCAKKYDISRHVQFHTTVTEMRWLEDRQLWEVTVRSNDKETKLYAKTVFAGYGPLSIAAFPNDIKGIDTFEGEMCHTAEWNKNIELKNKRVAVVGTGASAIQVVPEIHKAGVEKLYVFQRTPAWVIPRADRKVSDFEKRLFARFPIIQKFVRALIYWIRESTALSFAYRLPTRFLYQTVVNIHLKRQIKDEVLRKKLTPSFDLGCKRVLITNDWYPTLQQPNVQLITNRIQEVKPHSIVTRDGDEYPVDVIIWSTGFQVQNFPLPIYGVKGRSLAEQWSQTMQAYRGVTVPNFPNLFFLLGPNTGLGHNSVVVMIEAQIQYIAEALLYMAENKKQTLEVKQKVHDDFNRKLQLKLKNTVWQSGGCHSWYQDAKGNNTTIWPDFTWMYILLMKKFDSVNYVY
ncbi:unnamed protein product [Adineta ricciae]|uniref:Flavin-containing monooxygenase n=1 Tax=Adineta ricciae TaxID=249248 RepID=A0A813QEI5_ADIRI|nr:unnamed protein product [Adineta ricciae]CAF0802245.1 unnamed protein product [Adineta ricciae]